jgi:hypothetical protein
MLKPWELSRDGIPGIQNMQGRLALQGVEHHCSRGFRSLAAVAKVEVPEW